MEIKIAEHSGFCFGVRRAINIAEKLLSESNGKIFSWGEIIHNPRVVEGFFKKGLKVITDLRTIKEGKILISSHGTSPQVLESAHKRRLEVVDATCPFVKSAQRIVKGLREESFDIFIVGDHAHPEVKSLLGFAGERGYVLEDERLDGFPEKKVTKLGILAQTTQTKENFLKVISRILEKNFREVRIFNTICNDTKERQLSVKALLDSCGTLIVVGGKNSANTRRLWEICKKSGKDAYHIEGSDEIRQSWLRNKEKIGVISGASTPDEAIQEVITVLKDFQKFSGNFQNFQTRSLKRPGLKIYKEDKKQCHKILKNQNKDLI